MPQLEISTYTTQIFWLIVTFISLWFVMAKLIVPKIAEMVELRKRKYDDYILKAEEINKKALSVLKHYEETLAVAKAKATEQIAKNESDLKIFIAQKEEEIDSQLKHKIEENEAMLSKEKAETLKKIDEISLETAYLIAQKLDLSSANHASLEEISNKEEGGVDE